MPLCLTFVTTRSCFWGEIYRLSQWDQRIKAFTRAPRFDLKGPNGVGGNSLVRCATWATSKSATTNVFSIWKFIWRFQSSFIFLHFFNHTTDFLPLAPDRSCPRQMFSVSHRARSPFLFAIERNANTMLFNKPPFSTLWKHKKKTTAGLKLDENVMVLLFWCTFMSFPTAAATKADAAIVRLCKGRDGVIVHGSGYVREVFHVTDH